MSHYDRKIRPIRPYAKRADHNEQRSMNITNEAHNLLRRVCLKLSLESGNVVSMGALGSKIVKDACEAILEEGE